MVITQRQLSDTFKHFYASKKASGILLIACTVISLLLANSPVGDAYLQVWHVYVAGLSIG